VRPPLLIELPEAAPAEPALAPLVEEAGPPPAMARAMRAVARPRTPLAAWFWSLLGSVLVFALSLAAWDWAAGLLARHPLLGGIATALLFGLVVVAGVIAGRELLAIRRLARIDETQRRAAAALATGSLPEARAVVDALLAVYAGRAEVRTDRLRALAPEVLDADGLLRLAEAELLAPLDALALREVAGPRGRWRRSRP
jgi:putative membrane protein